jgi:predicted nucleotidyltransferase
VEPRDQRKPKDRDFLRTREGMLFCVTGYLHPPDRYTAYLKYYPDPGGKWRDGETAYRRELAYYHVRNVAKTIRYLEEHHPRYVSDCPVRGIRFSMISRDDVARYYLPQERLQEILSSPRDPLEEETCALVAHLASAAGLPPSLFGVTGSLLTSSHNPAFSDIDLLIYGQAHAATLRAILGSEGRTDFRRPTPEQLAPWCRRVAQQFQLTRDEAVYLARRRWNYGHFGERYVSIHAIRQDDEITEQYGDRIYRGQGVARIRAILADVSEALFLPAVYRVAGVQVLEGNPAVAAVREIVSHEGLFCDIAEAGEGVEAYGKLETVNGVPRQLVVGAMQPAAATIRPLRVKGG